MFRSKPRPSSVASVLFTMGNLLKHRIPQHVGKALLVNKLYSVYFDRACKETLKKESIIHHSVMGRGNVLLISTTEWYRGTCTYEKASPTDKEDLKRFFVNVKPIQQIDKFPWSVLLSTIEMASKLCSNQQRVVSLKSFEHFDVISMVDKSLDHGKLLSTCFFTIESCRF